MAEQTSAVEVLLAHQRHRGDCLCGPLRLGASHPQHVADTLAAAGLLGQPAPRTVTAEERDRAVAAARSFVERARAADLPFEETWLGAVASYLTAVGITVEVARG